MPTPFTFTGRLVQGDPHKAGPAPIDKKTRAPKLSATTGLPIPGSFFVAVAIPKDPTQRLVVQGLPGTYEQSKADLDADARAAWPQFFNAQQRATMAASGIRFDASLAPDCTNPTFANKIIDGDGFDDKGQPYSAKEGYAGCWVVKADTQFAPKVYEWAAAGWSETIYTGRTVKCGDYVTITGNCKSNGSTDSPGQYMNLDAVTFEREGAAIVSAVAVDPNAAFGQRGAVTGAPAVPPVSAHAASPPAPAASAVPPVSPTASPGSYTGYMDPQAAAAAPAPPAPAAVAGPVMLPAANGITYEAYRAANWTDEQLRAQGMMA